MKTPSSPGELFALNEKSSLTDAILDLLNEREASPRDLQDVLHNMAAMLVKYHEDFLKDKDNDLDTVQKVQWLDDLYNLTQIVKYSGRLR